MEKEFCGGVGILEQEQSFWMSSFRRGGNFIIERKPSSSLAVDKRTKELSCEEALLNEKPRRSN